MNLPLIVDAIELQQALAEDRPSGQPPLKLVDLRPPEAYLAGHIPGARHLDARLLNRSAPPFVGLLPDETGIRELIDALGLQQDEHVVAVDAGKATEAARLVWVLQAWGFMATSWLNGGFGAWQAAGGILQPGSAATNDTSDAGARYQPVLQADNRATADELLAELDDPELRVLDVRGPKEFEGSDRRSAEGGHVPGARHLEWTTQLDADGRLLPPEALLDALQALDVRPQHRVVAYCQSHQRSSVTWLALRSLGFDQVRGLDGAWSVWGNRAELPKETG